MVDVFPPGGVLPIIKREEPVDKFGFRDTRVGQLGKGESHELVYLLGVSQDFVVAKEMKRNILPFAGAE